MPRFSQRAVAPASQAHLGADIEEQEKRSQPDDAQPERHHQDTAPVARGGWLYCWLLAPKSQAKTDQYCQAERHPDKIDTVPAKLRREQPRRRNRTEPGTCAIEGVQI